MSNAGGGSGDQGTTTHETNGLSSTHQTDVQMTSASPATGRMSVREFFNHNLVVGLVVLALTSLGSMYFLGRSEKSDLRKARILLAKDIEPWATRYVLTVRDSANLRSTYGDAAELGGAVDVLRRLRNESAELFSSRAAEIGAEFGADAREGFVSMDASLLRLQHSYEIILARMSDDAQDGAERRQLRLQASNALRDLDASYRKLVGEMSSQLVADAGIEELGSPQSAIQWIETTILVNGLRGSITLKDGESFSYSWSSPDAMACQIETPTGPSGISRAGIGGPVVPAHPWYPRPGTTSALKLTCTNGWTNGADEITIQR
ncbi:MAG: hypothetical protein AB7O67_11340 [Vicinamibacterales bacterium]